MLLRPAVLIIAIFALASVTQAAPAPSPSPVPGGGRVLLHNQPNYRGATMTLLADRANLVGGITVKSATIEGGAWELCSQPNFKPPCVRTYQSVPDLAAAGLAKGVRSVRSTIGPRPVAGQTGPSMKGAASEFFPAPMAGGARVTACPSGGVAAACVNRQAIQYCAALGYLRMRNVDVQTGKGGVYLSDLLCSKT